MQNTTAIILVILFIGTLMLPKLWKYIVNGLLLVSLGVLPILHSFGRISFNPLEFPLFEYFILVMVILCGRELIVEGVREESPFFKWSSISLGILLITMTTIPALYSMGAIDFTLPAIPDVILYGIYIVAGVLLAVGAFAFANDSDKI